MYSHVCEYCGANIIDTDKAVVRKFARLHKGTMLTFGSHNLVRTKRGTLVRKDALEMANKYFEVQHADS